MLARLLQATLAGRSLGPATPSLANLTYTGQIMDAQATTPRGIFFGNNGSYLYELSPSPSWRWDLSTPYDLSTATLAHSGSFGDGSNSGFHINSTGTVITVANYLGIYQYALDTAWNISGFTQTAFNSLSSQSTANIHDLWFSTNGEYLFVPRDDKVVYKYSVSTPFDISSGLTYINSKDFTSISGTGAIRGICMDYAGTRLYLADEGTDYIYEYVLTTPWDITTISSANASFDASSYDSAAQGLWISPDNSLLFYVGSGSSTVTGTTDTISKFSF